MYVDRPTLKRDARQAMRAARPRAMLVTLLFTLLTAGLSTLVELMIANPVTLLADLADRGLTADRALLVVFSNIGPTGLFLHILVFVFSLVISFGYSRWALTVSRREQATLSDLVHGFSMVGRVLGLSLLTALCCVGWAIFLFMAGMLLMMAVMWIPLLNIIALFVLIFGGAAFYLSRILRYSMAVYCLLDDPEAGAFQSLRRSALLMRGKVVPFFVLQLSFLGWYLLSALIGSAATAAAITVPVVGGIAGNVILLASLPLRLWLQAYTNITWCRFYDNLPRSQAHETPFEL